MSVSMTGSRLNLLHLFFLFFFMIQRVSERTTTSFIADKLPVPYRKNLSEVKPLIVNELFGSCLVHREESMTTAVV